MKPRRLIPLIAVALGSLALAVTAAWAGFPDFQSFRQPILVYGASAPSSAPVTASVATTTATDVSDPRVFVGDIVITGADASVLTRLTAPFEAVYVCVDAAGQVPAPLSRTTLVGELHTAAVFPVNQHGRAKGSLLTGSLPSAAAAAAASHFACPSGQRLEFDHVTFSGLVLAIDGGGHRSLHTTLVSHSVYGIH